jgi:hypothetical protein
MAEHRHRIQRRSRRGGDASSSAGGPAPLWYPRQNVLLLLNDGSDLADLNDEKPARSPDPRRRRRPWQCLYGLPLPNPQADDSPGYSSQPPALAVRARVRSTIDRSAGPSLATVCRRHPRPCSSHLSRRLRSSTSWGIVTESCPVTSCLIRPLITASASEIVVHTIFRIQSSPDMHIL